MYRTASILIALALIVSAGCSKPPEAEILASQNALTAARDAEAEEYAAEAYRMAADTLNAALAAKQEQDSKFALFRSYGDSKELFVRAQVLAENAAAQAAAEKERLMAEVNDLLAQARTAIDNASAALASAPRGKGSAAEIELIKSDLAGATAALDEATLDFQNGRYRVAQAKAQSVIDKANAIVSEIAAAAARKAGR